MKPKKTGAVAVLKRLAWFFALQIVLLIPSNPGIARAIAPTHPLDPLTAEELAVVRDVLSASGAFSPNTNFVWVELDEPAKAVVEGFRPGSDFPRRARLAAVDYDKMKTSEVVVDIGARRIASIKDLGGLQPGIDGRDIAIARSVVDSDAAIKQALIRRGMKIPGKVSEAVQVLYYSIGRDATFENNRHRLMRVAFASDQIAVNMGSPFVDGLMAVIDLYSRKAIQIYDRAGVQSSKVPHDIFNPTYRTVLNQTDRRAAQRSGDIKIEQNVVSWRNWRFRYGFNLREGLVLYQIAVNDAGKWRSVVYRASVSETLTSYLDPDGFRSWLEVLDEGGGGLGYDSIAVQPGREVPGAATALNVLLPNPTRPAFSSTFGRRVYLYERDGGNLMYYRQGDRTAHASATELVVGFFASLGNYDYGFNWVFKQDGSFAFEVELAGEVLTKFVEAKKCQTCAAIANGTGNDGRAIESRGDDQYGTLVYPNVVALNHQHWFNLRLDFDIDGTKNAVMENNMRRVERDSARKEPDDDPVFIETHTIFRRAVDAKRDADHETSRSWTIYNPASVNQIGRPAGYMIMPGENAMAEFPMRRETGTVGFAFHHLWVTPLRDHEIYAAGAYPDQAKSDYRDTLYYYANDEAIYDKDIVVWYSLGMTHAPRVEDYPLMSDVKLGVSFLPDGFFSRNPALGSAPDR